MVEFLVSVKHVCAKVGNARVRRAAHCARGAIQDEISTFAVINRFLATRVGAPQSQWLAASGQVRQGRRLFTNENE